LDLRYYTYREAIKRLGLNITVVTFSRWMTEAKKIAEGQGQSLRPIKRRYVNDQLVKRMFVFLEHAPATSSGASKRGKDGKFLGESK
jgi:hypothetical protein